MTFECNPYYHLDLQKFWIELKIGFVNIFHEVDDGTKQNQQLRSEFREITGDAEPELRRNFSVNWWTIYRYPSTTTTIQELVHEPTLCTLYTTGINYCDTLFNRQYTEIHPHLLLFTTIECNGTDNIQITRVFCRQNFWNNTREVHRWGASCNRKHCWWPARVQVVPVQVGWW